VAAAITLNSDSLNPVVDDDPVSGNVREPLLKVIQVMRSMSFQRRQYVKLRHGILKDVGDKIGQMVFEAPDQFSFFSSDYSPPGIFAENEMVTPEGHLLTMNNLIGLSNGLFSLVNFGLSFVDGGFGPFLSRTNVPGDYSSSAGLLTYEPSGVDVGSKIDDLATMLTAGRLSDGNKDALTTAYNYFVKNHDSETADRVLLELMLSTPEFHTSNSIHGKSSSPRISSATPEKSSEPYKAIVFINLEGGVDSFNILTPHNDGGCYLYQEYFEARGGVGGIGLTTDQILPIDASSAEIPGCNTFGVNSLLPAYKEIYDEGKGIFLANFGHLHKPITKENWLAETRTDLFSHHTMKKQCFLVDAFKEAHNTGILGRMLDVLQGYGHAVSGIAVDSKDHPLDGHPSFDRIPMMVASKGAFPLFERGFLSFKDQNLREFLSSLHSETGDNSGAFSDMWSEKFIDSWDKMDAVFDSLRGTDLLTSFRSVRDAGNINRQLKMVSQLIVSRNERGTNGINRDAFYVSMDGFDSHSSTSYFLGQKLPALNSAVANFWAEMKAQGLENQVTVVQGSEFGRTIYPNTASGSDHAWGGNYFMFGGAVSGGKIIGEYPRSFAESDPTNIGHGRLLPTRSWDSVWYGIAQWFGITDLQELNRVLPNSRNFGCDLYNDSDLFTGGTQSTVGCGGPELSSEITFSVPEPNRYLTGEEQKQICAVAVQTASSQLAVDQDLIRCYISDQVIQPSTAVPGAYDIVGTAVMNFDSSVSSEVASSENIAIVSAIAAAISSEYVVDGAIIQN
jgi:uncharacterized protein (DUF1501 family)